LGEPKFITRGNVHFDPSNWEATRVNDQHLQSTLFELLKKSKVVASSLFDRTSRKIELDRQIDSLCEEVFKAVSEVNEQDKNQYHAARLASYLFECFTPYWIEVLLKQGHDTIGTLFWQEILSITNKWEKTSGIEVHKGTPYFFLAENYLLLGDRDLAFTYLYNALQDDKTLGRLDSSINYPKMAPSYLTATMNPNRNNQMYYLVAELRTKLSDYISLFNNRYPRPQPFTIQDFDVKFLANDDLFDVVSFFVFNFLYLTDLGKNTQPNLLKNQFSSLRALDTIFNFCLVIDETLKYAELKKVSITQNRYISDGILWLVCDYQRWMTRDRLTDFWGPNHLDLNNTKTDLTR
jgi:hypothetical protein